MEIAPLVVLTYESRDSVTLRNRLEGKNLLETLWRKIWRRREIFCLRFWRTNIEYTCDRRIYAQHNIFGLSSRGASKTIHCIIQFLIVKFSTVIKICGKYIWIHEKEAGKNELATLKRVTFNRAKLKRRHY